jgi:hypothetical protein
MRHRWASAAVLVMVLEVIWLLASAASTVRESVGGQIGPVQDQITYFVIIAVFAILPVIIALGLFRRAILGWITFVVYEILLMAFWLVQSLSK